MFRQRAFLRLIALIYCVNWDRPVDRGELRNVYDPFSCSKLQKENHFLLPCNVW